MHDNNSIVVVCGADNKYSMPLAVTLRSVLENLAEDRKISFFIFDGGISQNNKIKIYKSLGKSRQFSLSWLNPVTKLLTNIHLSGHISKASYLRLLIPDLLAPQIKKAIYLDSDLLVMNDLGKLWDTEIKDYPLLACQDSGVPYISSTYGVANYDKLGIPANYKYFNSGVLVLNLDIWRLKKIGIQVIEYSQKNKDYMHFHDQEALNAVLAGQWKELHPKWNQTPGIYQFSSWKDSSFSEEVYQTLVSDPSIIHFASSVKPWNSTLYHPANHIFFQYLDLTAWSGWRYTTWRRAWNKVTKKVRQVNNLYKAS